MEFLLDRDLEHGIRLLWDRLRDNGLPSLATHPHPTNRPHLTVITAVSLVGLPLLPLPVPVELGQVRLLGRALVRDVTPTAQLRDIQAHAWSSLAEMHAWPAPADWMPHLSLALNVPTSHRDIALHLLARLPPVRGYAVAARSYDTQARIVTDL